MRSMCSKRRIRPFCSSMCLFFFIVASLLGLKCQTVYGQHMGQSSRNPSSSKGANLPSFLSRIPFMAGTIMGQTSAVSPVSIGLGRAFQNEPGEIFRKVSITIQQNCRRFGGPETPTSFNLSPPYGLARGGSQVKTKKRRSTSSSSSTKKKKKKSHHESPLSSSKSFYPLDRIAELTLDDVGKVFEYAVKSTRDDYDEGTFMGALSPRVKSALHAVHKVTAKSRGHHVKVLTIKSDELPKSGEVDTFNFCAAMRILTEWRMLRQVPPGYKGFAVSMKMGHNDVVKNIGKMEEAAHDYIDGKREQGSKNVYSPTLRQLLQFEKDKELHPKLPKLKEVSGAMGLLWVRRQLHFQLAFFENAFDKSFSSSSEAFQSAYAKVYSNYHGRAVKTIFNRSLQGAPDIHEVYKCMNPHRLKEVVESPPKLMADSSESDTGAPSRFGQLARTKHAGEQTAVATDNLSETKSSTDDELEQLIVRAMEEDAHEKIDSFLQITKPIMIDLGELIDELNMNDPKKV